MTVIYPIYIYIQTTQWENKKPKQRRYLNYVSMEKNIKMKKI